MIGISRTPAIGAIGVAQFRVMNAFQTQLNTDLDDTFFGETEFAEPVTYTHYGTGQTVTYRGIFDNPTQELSANAQTESIQLQPQVQIALHQTKQEPSVKDTIKIRGIQYKIESLEKDGVGVATLFLVRETGRLH